MSRLSVRLVISHVAVALLGGLATFLVVRWLAPALFDHGLQGAGLGPGNGQMSMGTLRRQFGDAVDTALVIGTLFGIVVAAVAGTVAAIRLLRPLGRVRAATAELAAGRYDTRVSPPRERELADLAADVNRLGHALAATERRRVRLLGEVAHEMRTPLTVIDGYVEGMIDGVVPAGPEELGLVSEEVRRLRRLTEDLSQLSRSDEGRLELRRTERDLCDVVAKAVERLRAQADDASVGLRVDTGREAVMALVDGDRIAQVVTNLVGNALRSSHPGGTVEVTCARAGGEGVVSVSDTGEGLAAEDVERVFERFYRVPGRGREGGSGIGLTIARGIAEAHGGTLTASSAGLGTGARFTLRLPLG